MPWIADLQGAATRIVLNLDVAGDRTLQRMADVGNDESVSVAPAAHIPLLEAGDVVVPERLVREQTTFFGIVDQPECVLDADDRERLPQQSAPVIALGLRRGVRSGIQALRSRRYCNS